MGLRRRAREHALQMLYQADVAGLTCAQTVSSHWTREPEPDSSVRDFAERLTRFALDHAAEIDALISELSVNWRIERIGVVDRNVLRMAIAEMRADPDTPPAVVIDEAVEVARGYGDTDSHAFVNGILEAARRRLSARRAVEPT